MSSQYRITTVQSNSSMTQVYKLSWNRPRFHHLSSFMENQVTFRTLYDVKSYELSIPFGWSFLNGLGFAITLFGPTKWVACMIMQTASNIDIPT